MDLVQWSGGGLELGKSEVFPFLVHFAIVKHIGSNHLMIGPLKPNNFYQYFNECKCNRYPKLKYEKWSLIFVLLPCFGWGH